MSDLLHKLLFLVTAVGGALFSFGYANKAINPLYHNVLLFFVSWFLFYALTMIAFEKLTETADKPKKKVRRKRKTAVEEA